MPEETTKPAIQSNAIRGNILAFVTIVVMGLSLVSPESAPTAEEQEVLVSGMTAAFVAAAGVVGVVWSIIGRLRAKTKVKGVL